MDTNKYTATNGSPINTATWLPQVFKIFLKRSFLFQKVEKKMYPSALNNNNF